MTIYIPYFYIIQDKRNGIYYAGAKWGSDSNPINFMTVGGYQSSSNTILNIIETFEIDTFDVRKIKTFDNQKEAIHYETRFLKKVKARTNKMFYNLHENDFIYDVEKRKFITEIIYGDGITNISQTQYWKESVKKNRTRINDRRRKTIEENWDEEFRQELKSKKQESWKVSPKLEIHREKTRSRRIKEESNKTELEKKEFSELMKNAYWSRTEEEIGTHKLNHSIAAKKSYENNPELRNIRSETFKGRITVTKDGKNKRLKPDQVDVYIKEGWIKGSSTKGKKVKTPSCLGKRAVNKNGIAKYISKDEINKYINDGWSLGLK
jgi:hypothetical protein